MTPYWTNGVASLMLGDVMEVLSSMEAESADTCVTSPPYW
jgi:DNA modification methylase